MYSWGEDWQQGFRLKNTSNSSGSTNGVPFLNLSFTIKDLSAGRSVLAFIKTNGDAFIIRTSQDKDGRKVRVKQKFVKEKIESVSCGDDDVILLSETGTVHCVDTTHTPVTLSTPKALCNIPVSQVACGSHHTVALTQGGRVYTWGQDSRGQLGLGRSKPVAFSPQHLKTLSAIPVVRIAAGGEQSFALSVSGGVFGWGRNDCGQLGLGDTEDRHTPVPVPYLNRKRTVYISCGKDHTAILTQAGVVFTFGSGRHGQLGHNSRRDELRPRLVAELWGAKVIQIACGGHHTLVLTDSLCMYSFGCGEQEQLGHGEESHPAVPLPVQLPQDANNGPSIRDIYAGGGSSFATCTSKKDDCHESKSNTKKNGKHLSIDAMIKKWMSEWDSKSVKMIKQEIHKAFSSASCMNQSFLDQRNNKHFETSPNYCGLDLSLAQCGFEKLMKMDILKEVEAAVLHLLPSLNEKPAGVEGLRIFLLLHELLHATQQHQSQQSTKLAEAVAASIQKLSAESLQILGDWWSSLSPAIMTRHIKVWKEALSVILSSVPGPRNSAKDILLILQHMYNSNKKKKIPESAFCLEINEHFLQEDLQLLHTMSITEDLTNPPLLLLNFAFVMDLKSKKKVFDLNSHVTQDSVKVRMEFIWPYGWIPLQSPYFELKLKRASLVNDTLQQLAAAHSDDFKKLLVVYFDEDPKITNVYKRDLFYHLFHELLSTKSGMFMFNDSKTLAWFPSKTTEANNMLFYQFGLLCGLALYNESIIHLPFPLVLFKKLLNVEPTVEDMMEFSPVEGRSLRYILNYEDDDLEKDDMDFSILWDGTVVDLDPQNPGKPLTSQNKKEFVDAYVNHAFNTSVQSVFEEFRRGFFQVCDPQLVKLFRPEELQGVLIGKGIYNWALLKQNTMYEGEYHPDHPNIKRFWEVFDELTEEKKRDFLWFLTGYRRVPILGMNQIQMTIRVKYIQRGSYDQVYPESLTCHSILCLPLYSSKEIMRDRLTEAVIPERGFEMDQ